MPVTVRIPTALRPLTGGAARLRLAEPGSLDSLIRTLDRQYPGLRDRLVDETGDIRPGILFFVNGEDVRFLGGLGTRLAPDDEVSLVPAAAGGAAPGRETDGHGATTGYRGPSG